MYFCVTSRLASLLAVGLIVAVTPFANAASTSPIYHLVQKAVLGGAGGWDDAVEANTNRAPQQESAVRIFNIFSFYVYRCKRTRLRVPVTAVHPFTHGKRALT